MKKVVLFLWLLLSASLFAQKRGQELIDSLQTELQKNLPDTTQVSLLWNISWEFGYLGKYEKARGFVERALVLADEIDYQKGLGDSYNTLATIYFFSGDYNNALRNYEKAIKIREPLGDKKSLGTIYYNISLIYREQNKFPEALEQLFSVLKLFEEIGYQSGIAYINRDFGWIYYNLNDYEKALKHFFVSEKICLEIDDKEELAMTYNDMAAVFYRQNDYDTALAYYTKALETYETSNERIGMTTALVNIGMVHRSLENYTTALHYYFQSLKLAEEIGHKREISITEYQLGLLHLQMKQYDKAEKWLKRSIRRSKEGGITHIVKDNYNALYEMYKQKGDHKKALEHYEQFSIYKDSLFNEENTKKLTQAEMNYVFEKQQDSIRLVTEKELAVRDATLEANRKQKWFYFTGLFGLVIIGGLLYNQSRLRKKKNRELDEANRIKTRFFSILNHDLRSPVSNLIHFLHLKTENPEMLDEDSKNRLEQKSIQGAENLLVTMEDLLLWSKGQMENFKPQPKKITVNQLFEDTKKVFSGYQNIRFEYHNPDAVEIFTDENYLKTIIRNLTSNAINVFTTTQNPHIIWKAFQQNGKTVFSITDNGPGADSEKFKALYDDKEVVGIKTGLGLHLIRDLAKAIDCKIEVDSVKGKGTIVRLIV